MASDGIKAGVLTILMVMSLPAMPGVGGAGTAMGSAGDQPTPTPHSSQELGPAETNEEDVTNRSVDAIANLGPQYGTLKETAVNAEFYRERSEEQAAESAEEIDLDEALLEEIGQELLPNALGPGFLTLSILEILEEIAYFYAAIQNDRIADLMEFADNDRYETLRGNLAELESNAEAIEAEPDNRSELLEERQTLIEETYAESIQYVEAVHDMSVDPVYVGDDGHTGYATVRSHVEVLGMLLQMDYTATKSALEGEEVRTHPAESQGIRMPSHPVDEHQRWGVSYSTLESIEDYVLYRITVPEEHQGEDTVLDLQVTGPHAADLDAAVFAEEPDHPRGDEGEELTPDVAIRSTSIEDPDDAYYVVVRPGEEDEIGHFQLRAGVTGSGLLDRFGMDRSSVSIQPMGTGFPADFQPGFEDGAVPDVTDVSVPDRIEAGEPATITIEATNHGDIAGWQSIAASLPGVTDPERVSIVNHTLDDAEVHPPGSDVGAEYGSERTDLESILIEGSAREWATGETHTLEIEVETAEPIDQPVLAKSVAYAQGRWVASPELGETRHVDQQDEFAFREFLAVREPGAPEAQVELDPADPIQDAFVSLNASASSPGDDPIETIEWTFPDGTSASGEIVGHQFAETGPQDVILTVTDEAHRWDTERLTVDVQSPPEEYRAPTAGSFDDHYIDTIEIGDFEHESGYDRGYGNHTDRVAQVHDTIPITVRQWRDIDIGTDDYEIVIWIDWDQNNYFDATERIHLGSCTASWTCSVEEEIDVPEGVELGERAIRVISKADYWEHVRDVPKDPYKEEYDGFENPSWQGEAVDYTINVTDEPNAQFSWEADGEEPVVTFDATDSGVYEGTIEEYAWDFSGDGSTDATGDVLPHEFPDFGYTNVTLTVTDDRSQTDTMTEEVFVSRDPGVQIQELRVDGSTDVPDISNRTESVDVTLEVENVGNWSDSWDSEVAFVDAEGTLVSDGWESNVGVDAGEVKNVTVPIDPPELAGEYALIAEMGEATVERNVTVYDPGPLPGDIAWRQAYAEDVRSSPTVVNGTVYIGTDGGILSAVNATTGEERWTFSTTGDIRTSPTVVDDTAFIGTRDGEIHAIAVENGSERWSIQPADRISGSVTVRNGTLYAGTGEAEVLAVDAVTGEIHWTERLADVGSANGAPLVTDETVIQGTIANAVHALNRSSGSERWTYETEATVSTATRHGETVIVGTTDGVVHAIDADNGSEQWIANVGPRIYGTPTVANDTVYVPLSGTDWVPGGDLVALDVANGSSNWSVGVTNETNVGATVADDRVFIGDNDGVLRGHYATNGSVAWQTDVVDTHGALDGQVLGAPIVVNGTLYVADIWGGLYAVHTDPSGDSGDSRVLEGTENHHEDWDERAGELPEPPELSIEAITVDDPVLIEEAFPITITVSNDGERAATDLRLDMTLPDGLELADGLDHETIEAGETVETTVT